MIVDVRASVVVGCILVRATELSITLFKSPKLKTPINSRGSSSAPPPPRRLMNFLSPPERIPFYAMFSVHGLSVDAEEICLLDAQAKVSSGEANSDTGSQILARLLRLSLERRAFLALLLSGRMSVPYLS